MSSSDDGGLSSSGPHSLYASMQEFKLFETQSVSFNFHLQIVISLREILICVELLSFFRTFT